MDMRGLKARRDAAWNDKGGWDALYRDAYDYAIPYRRSVPQMQAQKLSREIFDITAPIGVMRFAGQLHQDMFPPGETWWKAAPGPLAIRAFRARGEEGDLMEYRRRLEALSDDVRLHFLTGEFDAAISEMCVDLAAGTGVLLPLDAGPGAERAVAFVCPPFEEIALGPGGYGSIGALFWKTMHPREAVLQKWPDRPYPDDFRRQASESPYELVALNQDFLREADGRWRMVATLDDAPETVPPLASETMRARPFASPRYFKVPGEHYGRGPLLMSLGAIKTLNRVVELTLKTAGLQMLGIWGYRPTAAANPSTFALAPGAFWPMQSTGGVMGPDVFRLDAGGREIQVSNIVQEELRAQIRAALHDDTLPDSGATPKSATEIMARVARLKTNYLGAFGRLLHETTPDIVPRVVEILYGRRLISSPIRFDEFLTRVEVTSPLATALRSDALKNVLEYVQIVGMTKGPQAVDRQLKLDDMLDQIGLDMGVAARFIRTEAERGQYDEQAAAQTAATMLAQSAADDPKRMAEAAQMVDDPAAAGGRPTLSLVA